MTATAEAPQASAYRRRVDGADWTAIAAEVGELGCAIKQHTLIGADGKPYRSPVKGAFGGHRGTKIFGRLDCPAALRAIARGGYVKHRVFFADTSTAGHAGYRPCGACMPDAYRACKVTTRTRPAKTR